MKKLFLPVGAIVLLSLALGGCATTFQGSAPARPGAEYVVGSRSGTATAWLCPAARTNSLDCHRVEVTE